VAAIQKQTLSSLHALSPAAPRRPSLRREVAPGPRARVCMCASGGARPRTAEGERSAAAAYRHPGRGRRMVRGRGGRTAGAPRREGGRKEGRGPERPPGSGGGGPAAFGFASFPSEARGRPGRGLSADPPHGRSPPRGREHAGRRSEPLCSRSRGCRPRVGHRPSARSRCSSRSGAASAHPPGARRPGRGREAALPRRGERDGTGRDVPGSVSLKQCGG